MIWNPSPLFFLNKLVFAFPIVNEPQKVNILTRDQELDAIQGVIRRGDFLPDSDTAQIGTSKEQDTSYSQKSVIFKLFQNV